MNVLKNKVILFKSSDDGDDDSYKIKLEENGFEIEICQVLDFVYCNLEELAKCLEKPDDFSGMIFTSPRAVKGTTLALGEQTLHTKWRDKPCFAVGEATERSLLKELKLPSTGAQSGSAALLANIITQGDYTRPLLFPSGNLKRDVLTTKLAQKNIHLHSVTVYRTEIHIDLEKNLQRITHNWKKIPEFLVFFSPSGVKFTKPFFYNMQIPVESLKVLAIGQTTEATLKEEDIPVYATALKPTPDQLLISLLC